MTTSMRYTIVWALLVLPLLSMVQASLIPSTSDSLFYCKCVCFGNFTIVPLHFPEHPDKPCLSCSRQFCLDQKLAICRGATVPDLDHDTGTGKEGDIEARCFQRDSPRDQVVVTGFMLVVFGLLLFAAIRNRLNKAIAERGRPTDLRQWGEALLPPTLLPSSNPNSESRRDLQDYIPSSLPLPSFLKRDQRHNRGRSGGGSTGNGSYDRM